MVQGQAPPNGAKGRWHPRDEQHLKRICALRPEVDTRLGATEHMHELGETGDDARVRLLEALVGWRADLETQMSESRERTLDARVFAASLELFRFCEERVGLHRRDPDLATPLFETLLYHLRGHAESEEQRFETLAKRLRSVPRYFEGGRKAVTQPSAELVLRARDVLEGGQDLLRAMVESARQAAGNNAIEGRLQNEIVEAASAAGAAFEDQRQWVQALDAKAHVPIGSAALDELLHLRGLDLNAAEVLDLSRSIAEEMRVEQARCVRRGYKGRGTAEAVQVARSANAPISLGEAVAWLGDLLGAARGFLIQQGTVPVPADDKERLVVEAMPTVLAPSGQCAIHLAPQPLAPRQDGLLLIREPLGPQSEGLAELSVADLESLTAGYAYPGRHLQAVWTNLATTVARSGAPFGAFGALAGTWGQDMVHGWSLAAEELMRESQFRSSAASRLIMVRRALVATLMAATDVNLAIGRFAPEQAASFLVRRGGLRLPVARAIVRSMLRSPTLGLSALVGKVRIEQLRREAHKKWRDGYSEKRFHSLLLVSGPLPLAYLFERLTDPPTFVSDVPTASFADGAPTL